MVDALCRSRSRQAPEGTSLVTTHPQGAHTEALDTGDLSSASRKPPGRATARWIEWRTCTRKVRFEEKPRTTDRMDAYHCPYCDGWHKTKSKRRIIKAQRPQKPMVLRGGFWIEK